jgi:DNA segregation ATPase FtsK/SpoIIIE-like protein
MPIGIFDEDRLKHLYVIGKTGTGKSRFLTSLMINDLKQGK